MRFDNIIIEDKIKEKILSKHNVQASEIVNVLLSNPLVLKQD
jgi:preprotein translocase subunit SecF